jgi:hypothetical protein
MRHLEQPGDSRHDHVDQFESEAFTSFEPPVWSLTWGLSRTCDGLLQV